MYQNIVQLGLNYSVFYFMILQMLIFSRVSVILLWLYTLEPPFEKMYYIDIWCKNKLFRVYLITLHYQVLLYLVIESTETELNVLY